jgi:protein-S-isoprenylcysteine O-methyltransferase Ste14
MSASEKFTWRGVGIASTNLLLGLLFIAFAYSHLLQFLANPRPSLLLIVGAETIVAVLLVIRRDPDRTHHSWRTWLATFGGTLAPLLLRPTEAPEDLLVGQGIQLFGFMLQIGAVLSLNRSFGLLPAHRGVKSDGLYRWVRHPLYSAYLFAHVGYLINNFSGYNVVIVAIAMLFQVWRILQEERLLHEYEPYVEYASRTRWRLLPAIW